MLRLLRRERVRDLADAAAGPGRRERRRADRRLTFAPEIDRLEIRITPAVVTWTGLGADNLWTTAANWDVAPAADDDLVFPDIDDSALHTAVNDFTAGTAFGSITIGEAGYTLSGNALSEPGGLFANYATGTSTINIATTLSSSFPNTVSVQDGGTLVLGGALSGANGISKVGAGLALFTQANSYSGATSVTAGTLAISNSSALGTSTAGNGTDVAFGATLEVRGTINTSEPVIIAGTGDGGVGALYNGSGNNVVQSVTLAADSTIGVNTNTFLLIPSTLDELEGTVALTKSGGGVLDVLATSTVAGGTTVTAGTLAVEGTIGSVAVQAGATFAGAGGIIGDVTSTGGTFTAGFATSPFTSDVDSLTLDAASTFVATLNGNTPGNGTTGYNQVNAIFASLGGATLSLSIGGGYTPAAGDSLAIITNGEGLSGTFNGLPEGAYVSLGAGRTFRITYTGGGSGFDVVLNYVDDTTTTLTSSANPSASGQSVTLSATVAPVRVGGPPPTGTVTFFDGATELGTGTLFSGSVATLSTSALTTGTHSITAVFEGDSATAPSTSTALSQVVNTPATSTTLVASPNPSVFGQTVTFTATVATDPAGGATPTGTVDIFDGATLIGDDVVLVAGVATYTTAGLSVGSHSITAAYSGDSGNNPSTSTPTSQVVNQASTTTTFTSTSNNPSQFGETVTFVATVSAAAPGAGSPTGLVYFVEVTDEGFNELGSVALVGGVATFETSALTVGGHVIFAAYDSDASFSSSDSVDYLQAVNRSQTSADVSTSATPTAFGQSVTFTATVSPPEFSDPATPTGTVTFFADGVAIGTATLDGSGTGSITVSTLNADTYQITAQYGGDAGYNASTSSSTEQVVTKAATGLTLDSSNISSPFGGEVTFTAVVTAIAPGAGTPVGSVQFFDGATFLGEASLVDGVATFTTSTLAVGSHAITAGYDAGESNFSGSGTGDPLSQGVDKATSQVEYFISANPSVVGQPVTITVFVSAGDAAAGTPTGSVALSIDGVVVATSAIDANGIVTFTAPSLAVGTHSISPLYLGDDNFSQAGTDGPSLDVIKASVAGTLASSTPSTAFGQATTLTATFTAVAPGSGVPTGQAIFYDGEAAIGTVTLSGGVATLTISGFEVGTHSLRVVYTGDAIFDGTTTPTVDQSVARAGTASVVVSSDGSSELGQSVTFTATVSPVAPGAGTPEGSVVFFDGATAIGFALLDGSGTATMQTAGLAAGSHAITARYSGNGQHVDSVSPATALTVGSVPGQVTSTTSLTVSQGIATFSQTLTFTAVVSAEADGPSGTVTFRDGSTVLAVVPVANGRAQLATSALRVGTHSITATYSGDAVLLGSTSAAVGETIVKASTFNTVTSSAPSASVGQSVTYTATVGVFAPGSGTPGGSVAFYDNSTLLGVAPLSGNQASLSVTASDPGGLHNIIAVYISDGQYAQSSSFILSQSVVKADATATLTFLTTTGGVAFSATVESTSTGVGLPGGTVTFYIGGRAVATRTIVDGAVSTVVLPRRAVRNRRVTVRYNGDSSFNTVLSTPVLITRASLNGPTTPVGTFRARLAAQVARVARASGLA